MKIKTVFGTLFFSLAAITFAEEKTIINTTFNSVGNANTWYYMGQLPVM